MGKTSMKALIVGCVAMIILVGCNANHLSVDQIVKKAVKAQEQTKSFHAKVSTTNTFNGEQHDSTYEIWVKEPNKRRVEREQMTTVSNGETLWMYDKQKNTVTVHKNNAKLAENIPDESETMREMVEQMMDNNTIKYEGKEKISGRQTIHLSLKPKEKNEGPPLSHVEIWLDQKAWKPLKVVSKGEKSSFTTEYESFEYNKKIDDSMFEFSPPADAEVKKMEDLIPDRLSLEEIKKKADFSFPKIDLPKTYEYSNGFYDKDKKMVILNYKKEGNNMINLAISPNTEVILGDQPESGETEQVNIQGSKGQLTKMKDTLMIAWQKGKLSYGLVGISSEITKDSILKIAKGI